MAMENEFRLLKPEEIEDVDTFTLEEFVQAVTALPNAHRYAEVLHLAQLELDERLEAERFANGICLLRSVDCEGSPSEASLHG